MTDAELDTWERQAKELIETHKTATIDTMQSLVIHAMAKRELKMIAEIRHNRSAIAGFLAHDEATVEHHEFALTQHRERIEELEQEVSRLKTLAHKLVNILSADGRPESSCADLRKEIDS